MENVTQEIEKKQEDSLEMQMELDLASAEKQYKETVLRVQELQGQVQQLTQVAVQLDALIKYMRAKLKK